MKKTLMRLVSAGMSMILAFGLAGGAMSTSAAGLEEQNVQAEVTKTLRAAEKMESVISDYKYMDFEQMARALDEELFAFAKTPEYVPVDLDTLMPLGFWDDDKVNIDRRMFGIPSYVGHVNADGAGTIFPSSQESITTLAAVLSGHLVGIDKTSQEGYDFVDMMEGFYNSKNGENFVLNRVNTETGYTFWYEIYPQILYATLYDQVRDNDRMGEIILEGADRWLAALPDFVDENGEVSFEFTSYDFKTKKPVKNGKWIEPPSAGVAFLLYAGYQLTGDQKYIQGAKVCMDWLNEYEKNPYYEVLQDYSPYMAAAMNFKFDMEYDVEKMLNWIFDADSDARPGLGIITGIWNGRSANGIIGSTTDGGGYGFLMNTYHLGSTLAPTAKYDPRFSTAIGRWFLNASNSVRIMYPNEMPADQQSGGGAFAGDPYGVIAYEGVRKSFNGKSPYAMGDPTIHGWGKTDYGLYGATHVGLFGALIDKTNVEQILRIDLNVLDTFKDEGDFPQYLYYNPYNEDKNVEVKLCSPATLFDTVTNTVIAENVSGKYEMVIPAGSSRNIVILPADIKVTHTGKEYRAGDKTIARDSAGVSILSPDTQKSTVSGQVDFILHIDAREAVEEVALYANDVKVMSSAATEVLSFDTGNLPNGTTLFQVKIRTASGLTDTSSIKLDVFNEESVEIVYKAGAEEIAQYLPAAKMPGKAELNGNVATITEINEEGDWGAVETPEFELDFDRSPQLMLDVSNLDPVFTVQLKFPDQEWGLYISSNNNSTGQVILDINSMFANYNGGKVLTGKDNVKIYLMANGKEGASFDISQLQVFYGDDGTQENPQEGAQGEDKVYTAEDIAEFVSGEAPGTVELNGKKVLMEDSAGNYGGLMSGWYSVDFDKTPVLTVNVAELSNYWFMQMDVEGVRDMLYITGDTNQTGEVNFDLKETLSRVNGIEEITGVHNVRIHPEVIGAENCWAVFNSIQLTDGENHYTAEGEDILNFESSLNPGKAAFLDPAAHVVENHPDNYGTVKSEPIMLNLDCNPEFMIDVADVSHRWTVQVWFEGDPNAYYMLANRTDKGTVTVNMLDEIRKIYGDFDKTGSHKARIYIMADGANTPDGEGAWVDVRSMSVKHAPAVSDELENITINPEIMSLTVGTAQNLGVTADPDGHPVNVSFASDMPEWVSVSADGTVTANAIGATRVHVTEESGIGKTVYVRVVGKSGELSPAPDPVHYIISATTGEGGSISPEGSRLVVKNDSITYTVTADKGYEVDKVFVDGQEVTLENGTYTFSYVDICHSIEATFKKVVKPENKPEKPHKDTNGTGSETAQETGTAENGTVESPDTGDTMSVMLWIVFMGMAVTAILVIRRKRA